MGYFFLMLAGLAGLSLYKMVRTSEKSRRYLQASQPEEPLRTAHLSPALQRLVEDTRLLRIGLEAPVRHVQDFVEGDFDATADDLDGFDQMLLDVTRQLTDWLLAVERLPEGDRALMIDLGADPGTIRAALDAEGWSFDRKHLRRPGRPTLDKRLAQVLAELARVETSLQSPPRLYR